MNFNLPINSVSFGQVSTALLRRAFERSIDVKLFEIGSTDLSTQRVDSDFVSWLRDCAKNAIEDHDRKSKIFKIWHLNGSLQSFSDEQHLLSFYELDSPTKAELNVARNNVLYFSSQYCVDVFKANGVDASYIPLFFDGYNFKNTDKEYFNDGRITFNLVGKFEKRKHHAKIMKAWASKYGNDKRYFLQCSTFNPFLKAEDNNALVASALDGKKYFNIIHLPFMKENAVYNDYLNSSDIVIGMSGGEGWGLPEFQSVALGKHAVILNANGYKSWATSENSTLVEPSGKIDAYDDMFFVKGRGVNQGQIFDFDEDDFISACEATIKKVEQSRVNEAGLKIKEDFSIDKTLNIILDKLNA